MAHKQAALRALAALAQEPQEDLALPQEQASLLARELWRFLAIKRDELAKAGAGADAAARAPLPVSPGPRVDALWHAMLLESEVADQVHAALGVAVPHSLRDATRLCDADKTARRGNALALFARRGWAPSPEFWREAHGGGGGGAPQQLAGGDWARAVTSAAPGEELPQADGAQEPPHMHAPPPPPTEAELRAKRERAARREQRAARLLEPGAGILSLVFIMLRGTRFQILAEPAMTVADLKLEVLDREGVPPDQQRLIFAGKELEKERTLAELKIVDQSVLHLILRLRGC